MTYFAAVNYLFETYATSDVIAETDADMMLFTQPSNMTYKICSGSVK